MQPTGVVINRESWLLLREEPLYSVRFIDREGTQELAVVSRVEDLDWFYRSPPCRSPCACLHGRAPSGYGWWPSATNCIQRLGGSKGGVFYLNPRQASDAALLRKLVRQEKLTVILLSDDTELHYTVSVPLSPPQLERWQAGGWLGSVCPQRAHCLIRKKTRPSIVRFRRFRRSTVRTTCSKKKPLD